MLQARPNRKRRLRAAAGDVLLVAVAMAVAFAGAEVATRILYHPENLHSVIRFDRNLGWSLQPGTSLHSVDNVRALDYTISVNSLGLREREVSVPRREGVRRIVFAGDSFAFGVGVEQTQRLSDFVGRALGDSYEVINAAVCGWGTDQELIHYERDIRPLRPDVVVLTVCISNDVLNNMLDHIYLGGTPKPRFVLGDSLELVGAELEQPEIAHRDRLRLWLRKSRFLLFVKRRLDLLLKPATGIAPEDRRHEGFRAVDARSHSHWSVFRRDLDPEMERAWRVTEAIIERFASVCRRDGAELVVLAFPLELEVDEAWRGQMLKKAGIDPSTIDVEAPFERLQACCRRLSVDYIHPVDTFRDAARTRRLYFEHDVHPNVYGHAVAARAVLDELHERFGAEFHVAAGDRAFLGAASTR